MVRMEYVRLYDCLHHKGVPKQKIECKHILAESNTVFPHSPYEMAGKTVNLPGAGMQCNKYLVRAALIYDQNLFTMGSMINENS